MITNYYKNQKIVLTQKGGKVAAKVGGVSVVADAPDAKTAIAEAHNFIDEMLGEKPTVMGVAVTGSVS